MCSVIAANSCSCANCVIFVPSVSCSAPSVGYCFKSNFFGLCFSPRFCKCSGVSGLAIFFTSCIYCFGSDCCSCSSCMCSVIAANSCSCANCVIYVPTISYNIIVFKCFNSRCCCLIFSPFCFEVSSVSSNTLALTCGSYCYFGSSVYSFCICMTVIILTCSCCCTCGEVVSPNVCYCPIMVDLFNNFCCLLCFSPFYIKCSSVCSETVFFTSCVSCYCVCNCCCYSICVCSVVITNSCSCASMAFAPSVGNCPAVLDCRKNCLTFDIFATVAILICGITVFCTGCCLAFYINKVVSELIGCSCFCCATCITCVLICTCCCTCCSYYGFTFVPIVLYAKACAAVITVHVGIAVMVSSRIYRNYDRNKYFVVCIEVCLTSFAVVVRKFAFYLTCSSSAFDPFAVIVCAYCVNVAILDRVVTINYLISIITIVSVVSRVEAYECTAINVEYAAVYCSITSVENVIFSARSICCFKLTAVNVNGSDKVIFCIGFCEYYVTDISRVEVTAVNIKCSTVKNRDYGVDEVILAVGGFITADHTAGLAVVGVLDSYCCSCAFKVKNFNNYVLVTRIIVGKSFGIRICCCPVSCNCVTVEVDCYYLTICKGDSFCKSNVAVKLNVVTVFKSCSEESFVIVNSKFCCFGSSVYGVVAFTSVNRIGCTINYNVSNETECMCCFISLVAAVCTFLPVS